jgi:hypothetical protein
MESGKYLNNGVYTKFSAKSQIFKGVAKFHL